MLAQGKKQAAGKKRKAVPFSNDDTGESPKRLAHESARS